VSLISKQGENKDGVVPGVRRNGVHDEICMIFTDCCMFAMCPFFKLSANLNVFYNFTYKAVRLFCPHEFSVTIAAFLGRTLQVR
jgi:hypothetical protein